MLFRKDSTSLRSTVREVRDAVLVHCHSCIHLLAEASIKIYHLDYEPTCKRRHTVAVQLMADVDEGKRLFELVADDPGRAADFKSVAGRLRRAIDRESPYSGDMHFLLRGQRSDTHPWIQELFRGLK
jgi:hypothetical protein